MQLSCRAGGCTPEVETELFDPRAPRHEPRSLRFDLFTRLRFVGLAAPGNQVSTGIIEFRVFDSGKSPAFPPIVNAGIDRDVCPPKQFEAVPHALKPVAAGDIRENDRYADQYRDVFGRMWDVFIASLRETSSEAFLKMVQITIETLQRYGREPTAWNNIISTFRKYALGGITSTTTMLRAENLFQQARLLWSNQ